MGLLLLIVIALALLFIPLIPAIIEWLRRSDIDPVPISSTYGVDVRYFAIGLRSFLHKTFPDFMKGDAERYSADFNGTAQKNTPFYIIGKDGAHRLNTLEENSRSTKSILLSHHPMTLQPDILFESEIYCKSSITCSPNDIFRAMLAEGNIQFGPNNSVLRWVHSEDSITAEPQSHFYGRMSAEKSIHLSPQTHFERLHAPHVYFGAPGNTPNQNPIEEKHPLKIEKLVPVIDSDGGRWLVDGDLVIPENSYFAGNIVSRKSVSIGSGSVIKGSIKSNGHMVIGENVTITESIVSDQNLLIGPYSQIAGPVIADGTITIATGCRIGTHECLTSISADTILIALGTVCHGTIWARIGGNVGNDI